MWSPSTCESNSSNNNNNSNSKASYGGSPSKQSSSCSISPSPSPSSPTTTNPSNKKSMEEVWKTINISSLHNPTTTNHPTFNNMVLQDFSALPFNKDKQKTSVLNSYGHDEASCAGRCGGGFGALRSQAPPPPATVFSSKSVADRFHYFESPVIHASLEMKTPSSSTVSYLNSSFDLLTSSTGQGVPCCCKKRAPENEEDESDRRHKRAMKNRESAARSRARKEAYTNELELEVEHLMKENDKLRRQQEKIHSTTTASGQLPKKHPLFRTLTAPF